MRAFLNITVTNYRPKINWAYSAHWATVPWSQSVQPFPLLDLRFLGREVIKIDPLIPLVRFLS